MSTSLNFTDIQEQEDGGSRSTHCGSEFSSLHESHSRYMGLYSNKCDDEVLRLGNEVPNFDAQTTHGPMNFHKWKKDKWAILFSHPADFTPVCTTELAALASRHAELISMGVKVAALSTDSVEDHKTWTKDIVAQHDNISKIDYPIISDEDRYISTIYGMLDQWADPFTQETKKMALTIRSVFFINPENQLMLNMTYPACVGRSMDEILRCVKALQLSYNKAVATPCDWPENHAEVTLEDGTTTNEYQGSVFLLPVVTEDVAQEYYPNYHTVQVPSKKPYLRLVKAQDVRTCPKHIEECSKEARRQKEAKRRWKKLRFRAQKSIGIAHWFGSLRITSRLGKKQKQ